MYNFVFNALKKHIEHLFNTTYLKKHIFRFFLLFRAFSSVRCVFFRDLFLKIIFNRLYNYSDFFDLFWSLKSRSSRYGVFPGVNHCILSVLLRESLVYSSAHETRRITRSTASVSDIKRQNSVLWRILTLNVIKSFTCLSSRPRNNYYNN